MKNSATDKYSAIEQSLGYIYQPRLALLQLLELPENTAIFIEKDDDVDFVDACGRKSLASLKHKAAGDRMTDLSLDFWKSVRIWLVRYKHDGRSTSNLQFFLFTTGKVSGKSFLSKFLTPQGAKGDLTKTLSEQAEKALTSSRSPLIKGIENEFNGLTLTEKQDFLARIMIFDSSPRIEDVPEVIKGRHMRSVRREHRSPVFERLEGWWNDEVVKQLTGNRPGGIFGFEVSDKLNNISEEYKLDNLPITFRGKSPAYEIDTEKDPRSFVVQLREIGISSNRIQNAILDYYRAFEQRAAWAREGLLVSGEIEDYEDRLIDEWGRYRDVVFEDLDDSHAEEVLRQAGRELYKWADLQSGNIESLRIRARVTEPYITRGSFHMLANSAPTPRVYWHPRFFYHLKAVLGGSK